MCCSAAFSSRSFSRSCFLADFAAAGVDIANGVSTASAVIIGVGCFAAAFLVVLWLGRGIQSQLVLHGFLMGLVATLIYVGLVAGSRR